MKTLSFGKRERLKFISCGTIDQWQPGQGPAIYALTFKQDADGKPKSHTVVFFGEAEDLSQGAIHSDLLKWWHENCNGRGDLYCFVYPMPGSNQFERARIKNQLAMEYEPSGNA